MRSLLAAGLLLVLQGCGALTNGTYTGTSTAFGPDTRIVVSGADQRLIMDRAPPPLDPSQPAPRIVCAEPSPDIAKAFQAALQASASAPSGPQGSLQYSSSEAITALAGRTPTVVALRDGLFRACEAYANGAVSKTGYALILSQYGDLLTTLMLGEAAATAMSGSPGGGPGGGGTAASGSGGSGGATPTVNLAVNATPASSQAATPAKSTTTPSSSSTSGTANETPSAAVATIAQGYFAALPFVALNQALLVSCLTNNDPTMTRPTDQNLVLDAPTCRTLIANAQTRGFDLSEYIIRNTNTAPAAKADTGTQGNAPAGLPAREVKKVQAALTSLGCGKLTDDGIEGPATDAAVQTCIDNGKLPKTTPARLTTASANQIIAAAPPAPDTAGKP